MSKADTMTEKAQHLRPLAARLGDLLLTLDFMPIPAGDLLIGDDRISDASPLHRVWVDAFAIAKFPTTNAQYGEFINAGGYGNEMHWTEMGWKWRKSRVEDEPGFWRDPRFNSANLPVVGVSWYEAVAFCNWLSDREGGRKHYRLPTEAEWEKAARGPDDARNFPWGDEFELGRANTAEMGIGQTTPVDSFPNGASPFGLWDMAGNVFEWTASKWGRNWQEMTYAYPYRKDDGRNDLEGSWARVMRGGSWFNSYQEAMCMRRARYLPGSRGSNIGFRVACWQ